MSELSELQRAIIRIESLEGSRRDHNGRLRQLEEAWATFVPSIARRISNEIIVPGIIRGLADAMRLPNSLAVELPDGLDIEAIIEHEKRRERG